MAAKVKIQGDFKEIYQSRIYVSWSNMKRRCNNPAHKQYPDYGGRGITYDPRWEKFQNFYRDMHKTYSDDLFLDRKDNNSGYSKNNCRWATRTEQNNNTRANKYFTHKGKTQTLAQWTKQVGIKSSTFHQRIHAYGWSLQEALFTPTRSKF